MITPSTAQLFSRIGWLGRASVWLACLGLCTACDGWDDDRAFVPRTHRAFVLLQDSLGATVWVLDAGGRVIDSLVPLSATACPVSLAISGDTVWVADSLLNAIQAFDAATLATRFARPMPCRSGRVLVGPNNVVWADNACGASRWHKRGNAEVPELALDSKIAASHAVFANNLVLLANLTSIAIFDENTATPFGIIDLPAGASLLRLISAGSGTSATALYVLNHEVYAAGLETFARPATINTAVKVSYKDLQVSPIFRTHYESEYIGNITQSQADTLIFRTLAGQPYPIIRYRGQATSFATDFQNSNLIATTDTTLVWHNLRSGLQNHVALPKVGMRIRQAVFWVQ